MKIKWESIYTIMVVDKLIIDNGLGQKCAFIVSVSKEPWFWNTHFIHIKEEYITMKFQN